MLKSKTMDGNLVTIESCKASRDSIQKTRERSVHSVYHRVGRLYVGMARTCHNTNRSLEISAKNAVIGFQMCLTFITECSVINKTIEVGSNHRGSTKLEVSLREERYAWAGGPQID